MRKVVVHESEVAGERRDPPRVSKILISEHSTGATRISMGVNITEVGSQIPLTAMRMKRKPCSSSREKESSSWAARNIP